MAMLGTYFVGPSKQDSSFSFGDIASAAGVIGRYAAGAAMRKIARMVPDAGRQALRTVTPDWIFSLGKMIANKCGAADLLDFVKREEFRKKIGSLDYAALSKQGQNTVAELIPHYATSQPIEYVEELKSLKQTISNNIINRYSSPVVIRNPFTWRNGKSNVFSLLLTGMNDSQLRAELISRYQAYRLGSTPIFDPVLLLQNHQHILDQGEQRPLVNLPEMERAINGMDPSKLPAGITAREKFTAEQDDIARLYRYGMRHNGDAVTFIDNTITDIEAQQSQFAKHANQLLPISEKALALVSEKATSSSWKSGYVFLDQGTYYVIEEKDGNDLGSIRESEVKDLLRAKTIQPGEVVYLEKGDTGELRKASKFGKYVAYKIDVDTLAAVVTPGSPHYAIGNKFSFRQDEAQGKLRLTIGNEHITKADRERTHAVLRTHSLLTMNSLVSAYVNGTIDQVPFETYQQLVISLNQLKTEQEDKSVFDKKDETLQNMLEFFAGEKNPKGPPVTSLKQLIGQRVYLNDYARTVRDIAWNRSRITNDEAAYQEVQETRDIFADLHKTLTVYPIKTGNILFDRKTIVETDVKKLTQQADTIVQLMNRTIRPSDPAAAAAVHNPGPATADALDAVKTELSNFYRTAMKLQLALGNESISERLRSKDLKKVARSPLIMLGDLQLKIEACVDKVGRAYKNAAMNITQTSFASVMDSLKHQRAAFAQAQVAAAEELTADYKKVLS